MIIGAGRFPSLPASQSNTELPAACKKLTVPYSGELMRKKYVSPPRLYKVHSIPSNSCEWRNSKSDKSSGPAIATPVRSVMSGLFAVLVRNIPKPSMPPKSAAGPSVRKTKPAIS